MASEQIRFLQPQQPRTSRRKRWGGCWGGLSCFHKQKGGKRIVPASRMPEGNPSSNPPNGPQPIGLPNQTTGVLPSLYAPPSSPASFSNSTLQSTAQSPNCFLSANSPVNPSSTMFVTGPYAHETQPVSPPVFSTFTTEPSTAPVTPPPELAQYLTTPSSPDVPYARFLSSKSTDKNNYFAANDLQSSYSLYPGSPLPVSRTPEKEWSDSIPTKEPVYSKSGSGQFVGLEAGKSRSPSPVSRTPEKEWSPLPTKEPVYSKSGSGRFVGLEAGKSRQDSNFFCPETFAQFYLDQSSLSNSGGRLSISRETDAYTNGGNGHQNRQTKISKPDPEEVEAYRASFGFSADEIVTTAHYVEISNVSDDSFSLHTPSKGSLETGKRQDVVHGSDNNLKDQGPQKPLFGTQILSDDEDIYSKMSAPRNGRNHQFGSSNSDAEIEYRRGRNLREERSWRQS